RHQHRGAEQQRILWRGHCRHGLGCATAPSFSCRRNLLREGKTQSIEHRSCQRVGITNGRCCEVWRNLNFWDISRSSKLLDYFRRDNRAPSPHFLFGRQVRFEISFPPGSSRPFVERRKFEVPLEPIRGRFRPRFQAVFRGRDSWHLCRWTQAWGLRHGSGFWIKPLLRSFPTVPLKGSKQLSFFGRKGFYWDFQIKAVLVGNLDRFDLLFIGNRFKIKRRYLLRPGEFRWPSFYIFGSRPAHHLLVSVGFLIPIPVGMLDTETFTARSVCLLANANVPRGVARSVVGNVAALPGVDRQVAVTGRVCVAVTCATEALLRVILPIAHRLGKRHVARSGPVEDGFDEGLLGFRALAADFAVGQGKELVGCARIL